RALRLAIENESDCLFFRENLRMLAHAPGLRLQVIARVNVQEPTMVYPLAVAQDEDPPPKADEPRMELPKSFAGVVCTGFDEIQRSHLIKSRTYNPYERFGKLHSRLIGFRRR